MNPNEDPDWYILKKYLSAVFYTHHVFHHRSGIDASEKTDDFVKSGLTTYQILTNYYIGFVPFIISMIFPLMVFIAVIFFTSKLAGRAEIVAIIAGGVPYNRFLRPYLIGAVIFSVVFWLASQYTIPKANVIRGNFQSCYVDNNNSYYTGMAETTISHAGRCSHIFGLAITIPQINRLQIFFSKNYPETK
jgi:lipopolysaccharide export system permease protein